MLNVIDEFTGGCIAIRVERRLKAVDVIDVLSDLFILRGAPTHIRSDNGPDFVAKELRAWIAAVGINRRATLRAETHGSSPARQSHQQKPGSSPTQHTIENTAKRLRVDAAVHTATTTAAQINHHIAAFPAGMR